MRTPAVRSAPGVTALVAWFCLAPGGADAQESAHLPSGEPVLRMPCRAGTAVLCLQGSNTESGRTHAMPYSRYALDFSDPTGQWRDIVAAADGIVEDVYTGSTPGDRDAGFNFGNHVKISHDFGWYTLYAHLDEVRVRAGETVESGSVLGTLGSTGNAGKTPHLHFSLHRGDAREPAVSETVVIHALVAADLDRGTDFTLRSCLEFVGGTVKSARVGHVYGSENGGKRPPIWGAAPDELQSRLRVGWEAIRRAIGGGSATASGPPAAPLGIEEIREGWRHRGAAWALARFEEVVATDSKHWEALYWIAVIRRRDLADPTGARNALAKVLHAAPRPPDAPAWLLPWALLRSGIAAECEGRVEEAATIYRKVLTYPDDPSRYLAFARQGLARLEAAARRGR